MGTFQDMTGKHALGTLKALKNTLTSSRPQQYTARITHTPGQKSSQQSLKLVPLIYFMNDKFNRSLFD